MDLEYFVNFFIKDTFEKNTFLEFQQVHPLEQRIFVAKYLNDYFNEENNYDDIDVLVNDSSSTNLIGDLIDNIYSKSER